MDKKKRITVRIKGIHGTKEQTYYNGKVFINQDTRGVLFCGHDSPLETNGNSRISHFVPFQLIERVEMEDSDGGLIVCNNIEMLGMSINIYDSALATATVERLGQ